MSKICPTVHKIQVPMALIPETRSAFRNFNMIHNVNGPNVSKLAHGFILGETNVLERCHTSHP